MTLPSSGPISINDIQVELGVSYDNLKQLCIAAGLGPPYNIGQFHGYTRPVSPPTLTPQNLQIADASACGVGYMARGTWGNPDGGNQVHIQWFVNGVLAAEYNLAVGTTTDVYGTDGSVGCGSDLSYNVYFVNAGGSGPVASSTTIHLNIDPCTGLQGCA